jgi:8-oxo-dGTP diphosphatase
VTIHGPADGWVVAPDGRKFWGKAGAAGLLCIDADDRVLLQHRAEWSHFGGTWGIPGGAMQFDESAVDGALRESAEEAAVPPEALQLVLTSVLDLDIWSYTSVVARAVTPFEPVISDAESSEISWIPSVDVAALPLHPGFASSWAALKAAADAPLHLVVDAANVVGSRPVGWLSDGAGWWTDRARATDALLTALDTLASSGVPADAFGVDVDLVHTWWPRLTVVVEGDARSITDPPVASRVSVARAEHDGDSTIVEQVRALVEGSDATTDSRMPARPVVITADRELSARVEALGASVVGPRILLSLLGL